MEKSLHSYRIWMCSQTHKCSHACTYTTFGADKMNRKEYQTNNRRSIESSFSPVRFGAAHGRCLVQTPTPNADGIQYCTKSNNKICIRVCCRMMPCVCVPLFSGWHHFERLNVNQIESEPRLRTDRRVAGQFAPEKLLVWETVGKWYSASFEGKWMIQYGFHNGELLHKFETLVGGYFCDTIMCNNVTGNGSRRQ